MCVCVRVGAVESLLFTGASGVFGKTLVFRSGQGSCAASAGGWMQVKLLISQCIADPGRPAPHVPCAWLTHLNQLSRAGKSVWIDLL